jgi:hypothetical protein
MIDHIPEVMGGEPTGTPARPSQSYQYPAVHDVPPDRANAPLTDAQQYQLEKELQAARDRQEATADPDQKSAPAAKKKPAVRKNGQASGAATKP